MNSSSKESYESSSDSSVATSSRHKTMHNKLCERVQVQYGKAVAAGTTDGGRYCFDLKILHIWNDIC